jgi:hypothetical protein
LNKVSYDHLPVIVKIITIWAVVAIAFLVPIIIGGAVFCIAYVIPSGIVDPFTVVAFDGIDARG